MKNKLFQILFTFITGASLAHLGESGEEVPSQHTVLIDSSPSAHIQKLSPVQLKSVLDLKLKGVDAYVITIKNPSQRSYSLSTSSLEASILDFEEAQKVLTSKGYRAIAAGAGVVGHFFWPVGVIGNVYNFAMLKKGKIFEGKLHAMLLDKEVIPSYSQLSRIILVKSDQTLEKTSLELIDMQTFKIKQLQIG